MTKKDRDRARLVQKHLGLENFPKNPGIPPLDKQKHRLEHLQFAPVDTNREPTTPPGGHLFSRVFRWTGECNGGAGFTGSTLTGYNGLAQGARMSLGGAPTSTATFDLLLNGISILTFTFPAGETETQILDLNDLAFDEGDTWAVEETDPKDSAGDYIVWVYVQVDLA